VHLDKGFPLNIWSQDHSEVPQNKEDWPTLSSILDFKCRVRQRLLKVYRDIASGKIEMTRRVGRVLFMTWEHEGFHAEVSNQPIGSYRAYPESHPRLCYICSSKTLGKGPYLHVASPTLRGAVLPMIGTKPLYPLPLRSRWARRR
jgi:hypothetical protein